MSKNFQPIEDAVRELLRAWNSPRDYLPEEARGLDSVIDNYTGQRSDRTHIEQNLFTAAMTFIRRWRKTKTYSDEFYLLKEEFDIYCRLASPHDPIGRDVLEKIPEPVDDIASPTRQVSDHPTLYLLIRNDLASMNAGKAVAQGSHAANQMVFEGRRFNSDPLNDQGYNAEELGDLLDQWEDSANGFGTCICLTVTEAQMRSTVAAAKKAGLHANICHDPTYPLRDGETLHLIPLDTCAYVFGRKVDAKPFVGEFSLMP
jgi:peptidyl-tRNA hydrolase